MIDGDRDGTDLIEIQEPESKKGQGSHQRHLQSQQPLGGTFVAMLRIAFMCVCIPL